MIIRYDFSYSTVEGQSAKSELSLIDSPALVQRTTETATFFANYRYAPKLSLSLGVKESELTYETYSDQLSSKKITTIPFNLIYHYSNKLSLVWHISHRYRYW